MENQIKNNPLSNYFRQIKMYIRLPSGTSHYPGNDVTFTDTGEIGVLPMTGQDELILKNPDALLNGEALVSVIKSCVPAVKNPRGLLSNDIDALITAIRASTYGDSLETEMNCPSCKHHNSFKLNLQYALDNMTYLESEYVVNLDSGLSIFIKPYGYSEVLKALHAQFEQSKVAKALTGNNVTDDQKLKIVSDSFRSMSVITYELIANSIIKIVDDSRNISVTERQFITDFLNNIDGLSVEKTNWNKTSLEALAHE